MVKVEQRWVHTLAQQLWATRTTMQFPNKQKQEISPLLLGLYLDTLAAFYLQLYINKLRWREVLESSDHQNFG